MESCYIDDSNGINETYSTTSTLDLDTPVITVAPQINTIFEGRTFNLTCKATGSESITYNWLLPNRTTVTGSILQISNINRNDAGNYKCTASSTADNIKTLTALTTTNITVFCKCTINMFLIST